MTSEFSAALFAIECAVTQRLPCSWPAIDQMTIDGLMVVVHFRFSKAYVGVLCATFSLAPGVNVQWLDDPLDPHHNARILPLADAERI